MSGGSMNYLYRRLLWESDFEDSTELRKEFRLHLIQVAAALKAIEWVDSGDMSPGDEDEALAVVLGSKFTNQCGETCERAKLCATCARGLKEPEQEPVAWLLQTVGQYHTGRFVAEVETVRRLPDGTNLFTKPNPRPWNTLSTDEIYELYNEPRSDSEMVEFARAVEAKLKERNT
jgi:hypothetical protein